VVDKISKIFSKKLQKFFIQSYQPLSQDPG